jgi:hypothetical protein
MHLMKRRLGFWIMLGLAGASPSLSQIISFQNLPYKVNQTLSTVDGWTKPQSGGYSDLFMVRSNAVDHFVRYAGTDAGFLYRDFTKQLGQIDLRWRWRSSGDSTRLCVAAGSAITSGIQNSERAKACLEGLKIVGSGQLDMPGTSKLSKDTWYYMRLRVDLTHGQYTLFIASDSLRADEKTEIVPSLVKGVIQTTNNNVFRVLLSSDKNGGTGDVDDIDWEPVSVWTGDAPDAGWYSPNNWNGPVPDTNTHVIFDGTSKSNCRLRAPAGVRTLTVAKDFADTLDLDTNYLAVLDNADFSGAAAYAFVPKKGYLLFASTRGQSLIPPVGKSLPPILHDAALNDAGTLRLDGSPFAMGLWQNSGTLDFNGHDLSLDGSLRVTHGGPASFAGLSGIAIVATGSAVFDGATGSLVGLSTAGGKPWHITVQDSLLARYAMVGNSVARVGDGSGSGIAIQSIEDGQGNVNWIFAAPPGFAQQPLNDSVTVGGDARFSVTVNSKVPVSLQWLVNDKPVPNRTDSVFNVKGVKRAYQDSVVTCRAVNMAGAVFSNPARIIVLFPSPSVDKQPQTFSDSLRIHIASRLAGAPLAVSLNGGPWQPTDGNLLLRDSTLVLARSTLDGDSGDISTWNYPIQRLKQAELPNILPEQTGFDDSITVKMLPVTPGSRIFYVRSQSEPDTNSTFYTGPFVLRATTTIRAFAVAAGYRPSEIRTRIFIRNIPDTLPRPPHPSASPGGVPFGDSLLVRLTHPEKVAIYYDFHDPKKSPNWILYDTAGLMLRETTVLRAFAVRGSSISDTSEWIYTRQLEAPTAAPHGRDFPDSLQIQLLSKAGETVRYTLDGRLPNAKSTVYSGPFFIDSTASLNAAVFRGDTLASAVQTEVYRLVPTLFRPSPKGGEFAAGTIITLAASSPKARIYYTLDGSTPGVGSRLYDTAFALDTNATLKAVAASGQGSGLILSQPVVESYVFFAQGNRTLGAGDTLDLTSNYSITNPLAGGSTVEVTVLPSDSLSALRGFKDIQFGIRISLPEGAPAFPSLYLNEPAGEERALYELTPQGARFVTGEDAALLPEPGTYFLGVDTMAPVIAVSSETFTSGDSTRAAFTVQDNVTNLILDLDRSDAPNLGIAGEKITNQDIVTATLKAKSGASLIPLTIKLRVDDHSNKSSFPANPLAAYELAQKISSVRSPLNLRIGYGPGYPWDLVSVPMDLEKPVTLAKLRDDNSAKALIGMVWDAAAGDYRLLAADEAIEAGKSVWLGMEASLSSLVFPDVKTVPHFGKNVCRITLHKGWNQISNPGLTPLFWPYTERISEVLDASQVKSLHGFNGVGWTDTDTLLPWKGYFVFSKSSVDVTVDLLASPAVAPTTKRSAARTGFALNLGLGAFQRLRLGASTRARDGLGTEDEPQPPAASGNAPRLWSSRERTALGTDLMHWIPGALYGWKVVAGLPASPLPLGNSQVTPRAALVEGLDLPEGYAAWAVSSKRGLKFALKPGAGIPLFPGFTDSLEILAGPAAELDARLASVPSTAGDFRLAVSAPSRGLLLRLRLPQALSLSWSLWTPAGRAVDGGVLRLGEGIYEIPLRGGRTLAPGLYLFRAQWTGEAPAGALSTKVIVP